MNNEKPSPTGRPKPNTSREKLIYALEFGVTRKKARAYAGITKEALGRMMEDDPSLGPEMQVAMAAGDVCLLEKFYNDSHWQAWRLILDYRAAMGKKRLINPEPLQGDGPNEPPDDPLSLKVDKVLSLVGPGQEDRALDCLKDFAMRDKERKYVESVEVPGAERTIQGQSAKGEETP